MFAALNVLDGTVIGRNMQHHRHQEFIRFLNAVEAEVPAGKLIHVILDNYATHKHPKVRRWLDRHERFTFHFVPTACSWLNAVEGFFAKLSRRRLKRGVPLQQMEAGIRDAPRSKATGSEDEHTDAHELRVRAKFNTQFRRLKDEARAVFGMVAGRPGVRSPAEWQKLLEKAGDEIGNGRFIVRCLGAERFLDAATVAVLITHRQNLIAELAKPTTADVMRIDAAVIGYYNMLRVQGWIGNLALVVERELFGQTPMTDVYGETLSGGVEKHLARLAEVMLPLLDRANRMMLANLPARHSQR